jgi:membrane-bound serine protease (ClpP class)
VILVGAILLAVFVLPVGWGVAAVALAALVEVAETAFWIWVSRRRTVQVGAETLIGALGEAVTDCLPTGQIRVGGELWQARCAAGARAGESVRIVGRDALTLEVEPA